MNIEHAQTGSANSSADVDVAVNIFAKPWQTALSMLSLVEQSGKHINELWLQFEPAGSRFDEITAYHIAEYLQKELGRKCNISQPESWLAREVPTREKMRDPVYRSSIRYQTAFENSRSRLLFLTHNDVYVFKDIIGALKDNMGDAFAIGRLGQCWNCPASNAEIMAETMRMPPCTPLTYYNVRPDFTQLALMYKKARQKGIFARPYEEGDFSPEFRDQPWPLPECRVNEWACLINLDKTRPFTIPFGDAWPPGAFGECGGHNLDVVVPFFRAMHARGMKAAHLEVNDYLKHWVGTGKKSRLRYTQAEDNAKKILAKKYPDYLGWLEKRTGRKFGQ